MPIEIIYKNRRKGTDRRKTISIDHIPERRSGLDRRKLDQKLKQLIQDNNKDPNKEKQRPLPSGSGTVILRKKNEEGQEGAGTDKDINNKVERE